MIILAVILIVTVFIVISGKSYAYFEESVEGGCVALQVNSLTYTTESIISLKPEEKTTFQLNIKSNDTVDSKYQVYYTSENDLTDVVVGYASSSKDLPSGTLTPSEEKNVTLILKNNSTQQLTIAIGVRGGLNSNTVDDIILEDNEYRVNREILSYIITLDGNDGVIGNYNKIDSGYTSSVTLAQGTSVPVVEGQTLSLMPNQEYLLQFDYKSDGNNTFNIDFFPDDLPEVVTTATNTFQTYNWIVSSSSSNMGNSSIRFFNNQIVPNPYNIYITNIGLYECVNCTLKSNYSVTYDEVYGSLPTPVKTGYKFVGWYTEKDGGTLITENTIVSNKNSHTLYAHWEQQTLDVLISLGVSNLSGTATSASFDITDYNTLTIGGTYGTTNPTYCNAYLSTFVSAYLVLANGTQIDILPSKTIDISGYTGNAYVNLTTGSRAVPGDWICQSNISITSLVMNR